MDAGSVTDRLSELAGRVGSCRACPRLVGWREQVARDRTARFRDVTYWGRPVPGFGDRSARIILVGLAPAAHGANRTGRMFTGDRSGDFLFAALHRAGLANQPTSVSLSDGLRLDGAWLTAVNRCAPPDNRPTPEERDHCLPFLESELALQSDACVVVCLGAWAWDGVLRALADLGARLAPRPTFAHGAEALVGRWRLVGCYHPSQQNTFTGRLTAEMMDRILERATVLAGAPVDRAVTEGSTVDG